MARVPLPDENRLISIAKRLGSLVEDVAALSPSQRASFRDALLRDKRGAWLRTQIKSLRDGCAEMESLIDDLSPTKIERVQITLGRSDGIAKYFAFLFLHRPRYRLDELSSEFFGSGVYAIYYVGKSELAYSRLSGSETPIYIGKADPDEAYAESTIEQGLALCGRLKEHAKSIGKTALNTRDFEYRYASIQSGMQASVEEFLINLFKPIWNKEVAVCHGIGKHGDSHKTRGNKRSPWDTMHPGRAWAAETSQDQFSREEIVQRIQRHLDKHVPFRDFDALVQNIAMN